MKLGLIPDIHFREFLSYNDYIEGGREKEENKILDFIIDSFKLCEGIVFLGDIFDSKTPSSTVIKKAVNFIERFEGKDIYIILGNHDLIFGGTKSSLDFLKEIKSKKWHIIDKITEIDDLTFMPYFLKQNFNVDTNEEAAKLLVKKLKPNKILFGHSAVSSTKVKSGSTDFFNEIVLSRADLEKKFSLIVMGHIHSPSITGNTVILGSVFTSEVGETQKYIMELNTKTLKYKQIELPGRPIFKVENPTKEILDKLDKHSIVKAVITEKLTSIKMEEVKEMLGKFDAHLIIEQIESKRKKMHFGEGESVLEWSVEQLLEMYGKEKDVSIEKLKLAFELIK